MHAIQTAAYRFCLPSSAISYGVLLPWMHARQLAICSVPLRCCSICCFCPLLPDLPWMHARHPDSGVSFRHHSIRFCCPRLPDRPWLDARRLASRKVPFLRRSIRCCSLLPVLSWIDSRQSAICSMALCPCDARCCSRRLPDLPWMHACRSAIRRVPLLRRSICFCPLLPVCLGFDAHWLVIRRVPSRRRIADYCLQLPDLPWIGFSPVGSLAAYHILIVTNVSAGCCSQ
ncbi:hypothetical protein BC831DRAFT_496288 [Entophlyctis helioformis]|nr:hypothetical protein BC831DRAFT_496288 [Entophlyctis helioformis]